MKLYEEIKDAIVCPKCKSELIPGESFVCSDVDCALVFPIINDVPVLINESTSIFKIEDFTERRDTTYNTSANGWKKNIKRLIPSISLNIKSDKNFEKFFNQLCDENQKPKILIIGGAVEGKGLSEVLSNKDVTITETDVAFGFRTNIICDGHDLPFKNETFDGVIIQAVLEHVLDPFECVSEIHRVLKQNGTVYAETPFMQQVHAGRYDFLRFTHLGHRRLFRHFQEIESGAVCGPAMALVWSYCYFIQSFFSSKIMYKAAFVFAVFTSFWLKYFDYFLIDKSGSFDAASGYYFWGKKSERYLSDSELIKNYKGMIR